MKNICKLTNQLSYSQTFHHDLASLVRNALRQLGTQETKLQRFDSLSTIQIELDDGLAINLAVENDRLWVWTLFRCNDYQLQVNSSVLLSALTTPFPGVESGQLTLGKGNEGYVLKALLNLSFTMQENGLSTVLSEFHKRAKAFSHCTGITR